MKKIIIIGGEGHVGKRLQWDFSELYDITSVDLCWFNEADIQTNVLDYNSLTVDYLQTFDVVILLAAHSSVKMCEGNYIDSFNNNVRNFIELISKLNNTQKFIYASSSSVYGNVGVNTVSETYTNFVQHNHYDTTKHIIDLYASLYDVQYYGLRFGTVCGFSPNSRNDIMINSMVNRAITQGEIQLYIKDILRPVLGLSDLTKGIKCIIDSNNDNRGVYNMASFNLTSGEIAYRVSNEIKIPIKEYETDPNNIVNNKLQTKNYNFSIDSSKFCKVFNFEFCETPESITREIVDNFKNIKFSSRNNTKTYV